MLLFHELLLSQDAAAAQSRQSGKAVTAHLEAPSALELKLTSKALSC